MPSGVAGGSGGRRAGLLTTAALVAACAQPSRGGLQTGAAECGGRRTLVLANDFIELRLLPEVGGRIAQFSLGGNGFLWVNPALDGLLPTPTGLLPDGGWFNCGGDKLWPAPQGWDNDEQWPGPPDAVLDGQPHELERLDSPPGTLAVRLTSRNDPRSGIRFSRVIRVFEGSTRVRFEATMTNIDTRPRRWGIWAHTQLDGGTPGGDSPNTRLRAWCPLNPDSGFPRGYDVIFGEPDNPSFATDPETGLFRVDYMYRVGKVGLDSRAGWSATVNGVTGDAFVQRFEYAEGRDYPDGSSVEFWLNGVGRIRAFGRDIELPDDPALNPFVFESEILSPFARLLPGEAYTWRYDWYACNLGGDVPVTDCSDAVLTSRPLRAVRTPGGIRLTGHFGVFEAGTAAVELVDGDGTVTTAIDLEEGLSPLRPLIIDRVVPAPAPARRAVLILTSPSGARREAAARADIGP